MKLWNNSKPNYGKDEIERAEMLDVYTRWLKGEKLSRKQKQLLKMSEADSELEPLKQLIDFAHYRFREGESVMPRPGAKQRVANELMGQIVPADPEPTSLSIDQDALQPAYSLEQVGSDSELAFPPASGDIPPPPPQFVDPFSETVILDSEDSEKVERVAYPAMEGNCNLKLRIVKGDEVGREYNIAFLQMTIGRGIEATIQLDQNAAVSRRHALLTLDGDSVSIADLGSSNGTYVDGVRITEATPLHLASTIKIGDQSLEVTEIQRDAGALRISFKEFEGPTVGQVYSAQVKEMTVGRGKAARIRFADATGTLSRLHARLDLKNGEVYVTDLNSKNGTHVNGVRIEEPTAIQKGATLKLGGVICEVIDIEHQ
ncbi:MAG: FHA domain-containing protein [Candidatus Poribacteria bacterium]|nr:FHA domain-containing protein [Candidatus Poribacteria bacterium]